MDLKWFKIDVTAEEGYKPPFFAGSMLRGALGVALKRVVCINPSFCCDQCFAADSCLYYDFYEKKNTFHPYRITSALGMNRLKFSVWIYEDATSQLPYMLSAVKYALEVNGLGRKKEKVKVCSIETGGRRVYDGDKFSSLSEIVPEHFMLNELHSGAVLKMRTPLRIKKENRLSRELDLPMLVSSIHGRYRQMKRMEPSRPGYDIRGEISSSRLKHLDLYRYSNRQKSRMKLGGLIGSIGFQGLDKQSYAYLKLGEVLGVGKQTVFGLGDYFIERSEIGKD
ncbi:CRISPR repeat RNA endoribonuclease Cas6 [Hydrogenimonas sp.]|nr:CRISPR repeat RNA endoribonuclease Cas6 [Hydrogenimonas sp.]